MRASVLKYLIVAMLTMPLLTGCWDDDDDEDSPSPAPVTDGGSEDGGSGDGGGDEGGEEPEPTSGISSIFGAPADGEPIELDDPEALMADIEATFGASTDDPREPGEVLDLSGT